MTWIPLHLQDGSPVDINMALVVGIVTQKDGTTNLLDVVDGSAWRVAETRDQIRALIAEASAPREVQLVDPQVHTLKMKRVGKYLDILGSGAHPDEKQRVLAELRKELGL